MDLVFRLASTAAAGAVDLWLGVVSGLALGLSYPLLWAATVAGNLVAVALAFLAGDRLQRWVFRRRWFQARRKRVERVWNRYGIIGTSVQAPLLTGTPLAVLVALSLGAPAGKLMLWMVASVMVWSAVGVGLLALGFSLFWA